MFYLLKMDPGGLSQFLKLHKANYNKTTPFGDVDSLILTSPRPRGKRLLQTSALIGQEIQLSSSCPIRARELHLLSNQRMSL